jgi:hypothetical protein
MAVRAGCLTSGCGNERSEKAFLGAAEVQHLWRPMPNGPAFPNGADYFCAVMRIDPRKASTFPFVAAAPMDQAVAAVKKATALPLGWNAELTDQVVTKKLAGRLQLRPAGF